MNQDDACSLARMAGEQAMEQGCTLTDVHNPGIAELSAQCDLRGLDIHQLFA